MKTSNIDLKSSVKEQGKYVTQIFHFVGGIKRTYDGIIVDSIRQGQFTKFKCKNGAMIMINDPNVLMIETFPE
jgi:hypothetical protein